MGTITFGGLATGLDTDTIITELMKLERKPVERLESDKEFYNSQLSAFQTLDNKMESLLSAVQALDSSDEIRSNTATPATEDYFTATAASSAVAGTYQVEVQQLAKVQKNVTTDGFASKTDANFGTGAITITIAGNDTGINYDTDSLEDIKNAINEAGIDVSASIINDGSTNGYRIVLTGDDAATAFTVSVNETVAGSYSLANAFTKTQDAQLARIAIDSDTTDGNPSNDLLVTSSTNTMTDAIPGVTLSLTKVNIAGENTTVTVATDTSAMTAKINSFVSAYNGILSFVSEQSDADWGNAAEMRNVKSKIQSLLTTNVGTSGSLNHLSEIGLSTDTKTGLISLDSSTFTDAVTNSLDDVVKLFAGETGVTGIMDLYNDYLDDVTNSIDGIYASRQTSTSSILKTLNSQIDRLEDRLEQKEKNLRAQFDSLEQLAGLMNSQANYLSQQLG